MNDNYITLRISKENFDKAHQLLDMLLDDKDAQDAQLADYSDEIAKIREIFAKG